MFLEFTLISKIQISHLYFVTYWVIAGSKYKIMKLLISHLISFLITLLII